MAKQGQGRKAEAEGETVPPRLAETLPPNMGPGDHSFLLGAMFELRGAFGEVKNALSSLERAVGKQESSIEWIRRILWFATGALLIIGLVVGYIADHAPGILRQMISNMPK